MLSRLGTFVLKKFSEKKDIHDNIRGYELKRVLVGMMLAQRRRRWPNIISQLGKCMYPVIRIVAFRVIKLQCTRMAVRANTGNHPILLQCWASD